ncbi:hypothetical protein SDC9_126630 [bioreactor metagenome]|uniref:Uncharacterized protein n=1 Tax=bioreactor metagenome TaxID=1076179 RepID=A0A645CRP2_9ZZZZ
MTRLGIWILGSKPDLEILEPFAPNLLAETDDRPIPDLALFNHLSNRLENDVWVVSDIRNQLQLGCAELVALALYDISNQHMHLGTSIHKIGVLFIRLLLLCSHTVAVPYRDSLCKHT